MLNVIFSCPACIYLTVPSPELHPIGSSCACGRHDREVGAPQLPPASLRLAPAVRIEPVIDRRRGGAYLIIYTSIYMSIGDSSPGAGGGLFVCRAFQGCSSMLLHLDRRSVRGSYRAFPRSGRGC